MLITYLALANSDKVKKVMGEAGSKAFAKVASLLLAAIAVMMIRVGLMNSMKYNNPFCSLIFRVYL